MSVFFNFTLGDIKKNELAIKQTWVNFRNEVSIGTIGYSNIDETLKITFLKVFDDLYN